MKDQNGNAVPANLVVLPSHCLLGDKERAYVLGCDWYEANGILLADLVAVAGDDPRDAGLDVDEDGNLVGVEVLYVDDCLKRGSDVDDFYHA